MMAEGAVRPRDVLTAAEIYLLRRALGEWSGPARCSDEFSMAIGFSSFGDLLQGVRGLRQKIDDNEVIEAGDWSRILLGTEVVFVSDLAGSGVEWETTTGFTDEYTILTLRSIQRKLVRVVRS